VLEDELAVSLARAVAAANARARRFYEARDFHAIRFTDGADNEERMPDIRYRWEGGSPLTLP